MPPPLYFDNNATTPLAPEALAAMLPLLREHYGNPSSPHALGDAAAAAVSLARSRVARLLGASSPRELLFTSGGTEAIHTAVESALAATPGRDHVLTSAVEHAAVRAPLARLAARGYAVTSIGVDAHGALDADRLLARIDARCALVSLMWVNNETGVVTPDAVLDAVGARCRELGVPFHVDAVQAAGKLPLDVGRRTLDLLSISGHKLHGPKGSGALWVHPDFEYAPLLVGGPQELDRRAGTENTPAIAGLGRAAELARAHVDDPAARDRVRALRDRLEDGLVERLDGVAVTARAAPRVDTTCSLTVPGLSGEALVMLLSELGLMASTGSACSSGRRGVSHVLAAMGVPEDHARGALRLSLSRATTAEEVEAALELVPRAVEQLRALAPSE